MNLTYGSVCSGIEAATVAWHPLGWRAEWFAEIEKFPSAVLAHHYPTVPNLGDMTKIAAMVRARLVAAPDVLVGGTPCQAFSIAGLRASLDDARGQLTLSFVDLANAIDTVRHVRGDQPATIVWENVPGVLSTPDNAFGCFLGALAGEDSPLVAPGGKWSNAGCVYGPQRTVAWRILDAQYFGVAQRRRRVFVIASARKGFDPTEVLFELEGVRRDSPPSRKTGQDVAAGTLRGTDGGSDVDHAIAGHLQSVGAARQVDRDDDVAGAALKLTCVSNAEDAKGLPFLTCSNIAKTVNNQTPLMSFEEVAAPVQRSVERPRGDGVDTLIAFDSRQDCVSSSEVFGALSSAEPQSQAVCFAENSRGELRLEGGDGQRTGALSTGGGKPGQGQPVIAYSTKLHNTTSNQAGKFYEEYTTSLQASSPPPAVCITGDITHTLKAEGFDASEDGTGRGQPIVSSTREIYAGTQETNAVKALRVLRDEVGTEAFAEWQAGIFDSFQSPEILRSRVHGEGVRREADEGERRMDDGALPRKEGDPAWSLPEMRQAGRERRSPQGRGFSQQHAGELDKALSELPHEGAPPASLLHDLRCASEGPRVLQQALHSVQGGALAVRRLTPRECERLQSFPDDHTLIPYGRIIKMEKLETDWIKYLLRGGVMTLEQVCQAAADGPRYKALGNSMCTRNMAWLGRRIELVLSRSETSLIERAA